MDYQRRLDPTDEVRLERVTPDTPLSVWSAVGGFIQSALVEGGGIRDWGMSDVGAAAQHGEVDIWALRRGDEIFGGAVSTVKAYAKRREFNVLLLGTKPHREDDWMKILEQVKTLCRSCGATTISGTGRPGWARKLGAREMRIFEVDL
jgi:hypothetical protein